ncbi:CDP-diacylglycerol--glycerol-3-phosphate 3-phosphatidyltransferase [Phycicoccus sp. M110.8]|uniref:CDP-diacylglycerol--glycerol-3-phosphate 3-phosphatidyltransferase n=1 Tax=Phycicoccus sp. M110.8 TaxID=3075433 RepID=UPI0028FD1776|nr:CDP-diacylglycerol--glycerol-3-phosphate 3-phosphatidyltransferase [Phycicoccus sp. M110.8]MDU0312303.1 CDP-diacylglycerol--glycerol-3-phosphate 3-phosphatidyltransferase [Phycicoccus sp. M110.8]HET8767642.1 CDP-diacylglycerol--glycerol-3-phosphate 3-phosphatidyltransferase [Pedococcus sp.]
MSESSPAPDPAATPVASPAPSPWNLPNALTVARILLVPVFGWLLLARGGDDTALRWWATAVFVLATATDRVDGDLARRRGLITNFGKIADPIADKTLMGMAFVGLSVLGELPWWLTVLVLVREWGVTVLRFWVIRHGVMPAGRGGKVKTTLQFLGLLLFTLPLWSFPGADAWVLAARIVIGLAVVVTVVTGVDIVVKALRMRQTSERSAMKRARRAAARQERAGRQERASR